MRKIKLHDLQGRRIFASGYGLSKARQNAISHRLLGGGEHRIFDYDFPDIMNTLDRAWLEIS